MHQPVSSRNWSMTFQFSCCPAPPPPPPSWLIHFSHSLKNGRSRRSHQLTALVLGHVSSSEAFKNTPELRSSRLLKIWIWSWKLSLARLAWRTSCQSHVSAPWWWDGCQWRTIKTCLTLPDLVQGKKRKNTAVAPPPPPPPPKEGIRKHNVSTFFFVFSQVQIDWAAKNWIVDQSEKLSVSCCIIMQARGRKRKLTRKENEKEPNPRNGRIEFNPFGKRFSKKKIKTCLSYPGQLSSSHAFRWASDLAKFYQDWGPDLCESRKRAHSPIGVSFECPYQYPPWSPVSIGKPAPKIDRFPNYCLGARRGKDLVAKGCYGPWLT